ncbi:hypothetical protein [Ewingella americana]|uniref:hypothetical protein n=1 Tax=Ewingella americana TaxID=41202 RepID=UPI0012AD995B|nr:hypothetical protein [Ewingella americana]MRT06078.1 hypothetical protein [Ewingella americana]
MIAYRLFLKPLKKGILFILLTSCLTALFIYLAGAKALIASSDCTAPLNLYEVKHDGSWVLASGEYHFFSDSGSAAKSTYTGNILYMDADGKNVRISPVNREVNSSIKMSHNRVFSEITSVNRRFGDHSNDDEIKDFIFYNYTVGGTNSNSIFLLNGRQLGSGPENIPRIVCQTN